MDNSTMSALTSALDFGSARLQAISNNLSNVSTPGYKRKDASFQSMLDAADGGSSDDVSLKITDSRDISSADAGISQSNPAIITDNSGSMRADGNNVDVDAEGARLASAQIYYSGAAQLLSGQFAALKYVIKGD